MGTDTAMPSGILWMAMATAMGMASWESLRAVMKVTIPSGKLWMASTRAVTNPVRSRRLWLKGLG